MAFVPFYTVLSVLYAKTHHASRSFCGLSRGILRVKPLGQAIAVVENQAAGISMKSSAIRAKKKKKKKWVYAAYRLVYSAIGVTQHPSPTIISWGSDTVDCVKAFGERVETR